MSCSALLLALLALVVICSARVHPRGAVFRDAERQRGLRFAPRIFQQTIDHFSANRPGTFAQRYWVNSAYDAGDSLKPVFLYINGEGPVYGPPSEPTDEVVLLAKEFQGLIVTLEHRFYGESIPTPDLSVSSLQLLTVEQALADLAVFSAWFNSTQLPHGRQWFTIGGSYSGALSSWYRLKYPQLTRGSIASSGVVLPILSFWQFDMQVRLSVGPQCAAAMTAVLHEIAAQVYANHSSNLAIKTLFNSSSSLTDDGDFLFYVTDKAAESVQYGYGPLVCESLLSPGVAQTPLQSFANYTVTVAAVILGGPEDYSTAIQQDLSPAVPELAANRAWWWQTCTQVGWFQVPALDEPVRPPQLNMSYWQRHCEIVFGDAYEWPPTVDEFNVLFGGNTSAATNVFYAQGSQDEWRRAGVQMSLGTSQPELTITCPTCGHCVDLRGCPTNAGEHGCTPPSVLNTAHALIFSYVRKWLS